ncbi:hypothetical protein BDW22DRAFT_1356676 [Trametopsis cervina]|nr:hypothetical protein BDW22DRAFT_1356676 [Trametopsis cervina]
MPCSSVQEDTGTHPDPYNLTHLLPVGTLVLYFESSTSMSGVFCTDHWHRYDDLTRARTTPQDEQLIHMLNFLTSHKFIAHQCKAFPGRGEFAAAPSRLHIRIFLIPFDLPNVGGVLRRREEGTILNPARKYMHTLLSRITRDTASWEGAVNKAGEMFMAPEKSSETLAELYNMLRSPVLKSFTDDPPSHLSKLIDNVLQNRVAGLQSTLYQYQRQSVACMVQQELHPGTLPDPLYVPILGMDKRVFYLQPSTMEVLETCPATSQPRGGILCEELGTGKTIIVLALILATVDDLPEPEESIIDPRPVLTPISFRYFPSPVYVDARQRYQQSICAPSPKKSNVQRIPSLTEFLISISRLSPAATNLRYHFDTIPTNLMEAYRMNIPFYHQYKEEPFETLRPSRKSVRTKPRAIFLTAATLIIVPANLLNQWFSEINKHCSDLLRCYVATAKPFPSPQQLATDYDVVLMTHPRLSHEATRMNLVSLESLHTCKCPVPKGSSIRVPKCKCKLPADVSPLLQVRWKRLVIDEGHVSATTTTDLMTLVMNLSVERKWIVTGTPTTNMMGLRFGEDSEAMSQSLEKRHLLQASSHTVTQDVNSHDGFEGPVDESGNTEQNSSAVSIDNIDLFYPVDGSVRHWTAMDRSDLMKLSKMLSSFLQVPQFATDPKLFTVQVVTPLMDHTGPRYGAVQVLMQVMQSVMIRHSLEDIQREVRLPPISHETVLLDLDYYAAMTYNVMQAGIVINAVTSERRDQDYMLHPRNTKSLHQLIENMSQAMFWHVDDLRFYIDDTIHEKETFMMEARQKLAEGKIPQLDFDALLQAYEFVSDAACNTTWKGLHAHPTIFNWVYDMPQSIYLAWSSLEKDDGCIQEAHDPYCLLTSERLKTLRNYVMRKPLASVEQLIEYGETVVEEEEQRYWHNLSAITVNKSLRKQLQKADSSTRMTGHSSITAARADPLSKLADTQAKRKALEQEDNRGSMQPSSNLYQSSPLASVHIGNSTSSKLDYILNDVMTHAQTSKFLIFSRSPLTLMYIAEALGLIGVPYKLTTQKHVNALQADVLTFETSETFRVFLMELKHGARGLNIISASRVIFCEPVWQADVEAQAIKRVHRIGQMSPVSVKTLAIRSTAEEFMVKRRDDLKRGRGSGSGRLINLVDDVSMRNFIAHPTFLPIPNSDLDPSRISLRYPYLPSSPSTHEPQRVSSDPPLVLQPPAPTLVGPNRSTTAPADHASAPSSNPGRTIRIPALKRKVSTDTTSVDQAYMAVRKRPHTDVGTASESSERPQAGGSAVARRTATTEAVAFEEGSSTQTHGHRRRVQFADP